LPFERCNSSTAQYGCLKILTTSPLERITASIFVFDHKKSKLASSTNELNTPVQAISYHSHFFLNQQVHHIDDDQKVSDMYKV
jgi:hypothetical protein